MFCLLGLLWLLMMMRMVLHVSLYVSISNMDNKRLFFLLLFIIYLYRPGLFCGSATATTKLKLVATLTGFSAYYAGGFRFCSINAIPRLYRYLYKIEKIEFFILPFLSSSNHLLHYDICCTSYIVFFS
jgi:hypothetical protein